MEHFKLEPIEYLDYYNNRRIGAAKGLPPAIHRQQALFGCLNNFCFKLLSNFLGSLHPVVGCGFFRFFDSFQFVFKFSILYLFTIRRIFTMSIIIGIDHGYYAIKTAHCSFAVELTSYGEHEFG